MSYSRRKFIKTALLGTGGLFLPSFPALGKTVSEQNSGQQSESGISRKKEALDYFYRREYDKAENLYRELIESYPSDISCYDGLVRVYALQNRNMDIASLYQTGLDRNTRNVAFYDRLGRSLSRLSLGSLKDEEAYIASSGDNFPIQTAILLYLEAVRLAPNRKYLREGLLDMSKCLEKKNRLQAGKNLPLLQLDRQTQSEINSKTAAYKRDWENSRLSRKQHIRDMDTENIQERFSKADSKQRRKLYFDDEHQNRHTELEKNRKAYYHALLVLAISENDYTKAKEYYAKVKESDSKDTHSKGKISKFYRKNKAYDKLLDLYRTDLDNENYTPWIEISLARTLVLAGNAEEGEALLKKFQAYDEMNLPKFCGAVSNGLAKCDIQRRQYEQGRRTLEKGMEKLHGGGVVHSMLVDYAGSYFEEDRFEEAKNILLKLTGKDVACNEKVEKIVAGAKKYRQAMDNKRNHGKNNGKGRLSVNNKGNNKNRDKNKEKGNSQPPNPRKEELEALYALAKMCEKKGNNALLSEVLTQIRAIDPNDKFLKKRA